MTLTGLLQLVVGNAEGGIHRALEVMNFGKRKPITIGTLRNMLTPTTHSHVMNIVAFEQVVDALDANFAVGEYFLHKANAVAVPLPSDDVTVGDMALLDAFIDSDKARADFRAAFQSAWQDGSINKKERELLEKASKQAIQMHLTVRTLIDSLAE